MSMPKMLEILEWPNIKLTTEAREVSEITGRLRNLYLNMLHTMRESKGIGLAANQVGSRAKLLVMEVYNNPTVMFNPRVIKTSEKLHIAKEGCLSFPDILVEVERCKWIKISYKDENWEKRVVKLRNLEARCFLHELDHLQGFTMLDVMIPGTETSRSKENT